MAKCPECGEVFDADSIDADDAAAGLVKNYIPSTPSEGHVRIMKEAITKCLVDELGVSIGVIE